MAHRHLLSLLTYTTKCIIWARTPLASMAYTFYPHFIYLVCSDGDFSPDSPFSVALIGFNCYELRINFHLFLFCIFRIVGVHHLYFKLVFYHYPVGCWQIHSELSMTFSIVVFFWKLSIIKLEVSCQYTTSCLS